MGLLAQGPLLAVLSPPRGGPSSLRKSHVGHEVRMVRKRLRKSGVYWLDRATPETAFMTTMKCRCGFDSGFKDPGSGYFVGEIQKKSGMTWVMLQDGGS